MSEPLGYRYFVESNGGEAEAEPPRWRMKKILDALDDPDTEHAEPWLTHESGWTLSVKASGEVVWANEQARFAPRHLLAVTPEEMLRLWRALAAGELDVVEREQWLYGLPAERPNLPARRKDLAQLYLVRSCVASLIASLAAVFSLASSTAGSNWEALLVLPNACLLPLTVSLVLTTLVRGIVGGGQRDRERRIARACYVLAPVLAVSLVIALFGWLRSEAIGHALWRLLPEAPSLLVVPVLISVAALLCTVAPPLIVAVLSAERGEHSGERR